MQRKRFEAEVLERADAADGRGRPPQGRVPRDPRARAAQPAAAAADRDRARWSTTRIEAGARRACAASSSARSTTSARLVDDLLDVARFQTGKLELRREPVTLDTLVEEAVARPRAAPRRAASTLRVDGAVAARRSCTAIPCASCRCSSNLLSNAIKYTAAERRDRGRWGVDRRRGVRARGRGQRARDHRRAAAEGVRHVRPGARHARRRRRARPRPRPGRSGSSSSTAAACTRRATAPEPGATFEIRLPIADEVTLERQPHHRATTTAPTSRPLRAVVVDDAADLRELVADLLRMKGHEVMTVEDGPSARDADPRASSPTSR